MPEPPKKSLKDKQKKKQKKSAQPRSDGHLVIRLKTVGPTQPAEAAEDEKRQGGTTEVLEPRPVNSVEDSADLAIEVASVQASGEPVLSTDEVRPTDGVEPVVETVSMPMPIKATQAPEDIPRDHTDTERESIPVSPPSSPVSTGATTVVAGKATAELTVRSMREDANKIMMMLERTMEKVCEWSERIEAQTSATAERDVTIWKRRLANCQETLKRKATALTEAEKRP
jgi:hypothetical protein